jgi:hypothetical protein
MNYSYREGRSTGVCVRLYRSVTAKRGQLLGVINLERSDLRMLTLRESMPPLYSNVVIDKGQVQGDCDLP